MVDWQMLEGIGGVATAAAVVFAVVFGVVQYRQFERQRRQAAANAYVANFMMPDVVSAIQRIMRLPDDAPPEQVAPDAQLSHDVVSLGFAIEGVGSFVHARTVDLHDVDRMAGGLIRSGWRKIRPFAEQQRATWPNFCEWWQWLVERMEEDPAAGKQEGAHVAFRSWRR
ncbi:MAG: hypothetical protein HYT80_11675 [Euryarchaeota archaeon]|nr:hypothetical protein [Euryarchaeota archaeon]